MPPPPDLLRELAHRLVVYEAGGSSNPATIATAAARACHRIDDELQPMLGRRGMFALMQRALSLAKREHPLLAEVVLEPERSSTWAKLAEDLASGTAMEAAAAGASTLAHLLGLLVLLLGQDLGMLPVRKLWPDVVLSFTETDE